VTQTAAATLSAAATAVSESLAESQSLAAGEFQISNSNPEFDEEVYNSH